MPSNPVLEPQQFQVADGGVGLLQGKSRKRVFPAPHTPEPNPIFEAYSYCNTPNRTEQAWEGETCTLTYSRYNHIIPKNAIWMQTRSQSLVKSRLKHKIKVLVHSMYFFACKELHLCLVSFKLSWNHNLNCKNPLLWWALKQWINT